MPKKILQGEVLSTAEKTARVLVTTYVTHKKYRKTVKTTKKYLVHDENNTSQKGDVVKFVECAPISKRKTWELYCAE